MTSQYALTHGTELLCSLLQEDPLCINVHNSLKSRLLGCLNLPLQEEDIHVLRNGELPLSWGGKVVLEWILDRS